MPEEGAPLPEYIKAKIRDPNFPLNARAAALGITIKHREHTPNTRRAHMCTEYARSHGKLAEFHHAVLEKYWSHAADIHDWAVLREAAAASGLNADELQAEVEAGKWKDVMEAGLQAAAEVGVTAVPTFIVGNRFAIQGAQEARVFRMAFERLGFKPKG